MEEEKRKRKVKETKEGDEEISIFEQPIVAPPTSKNKRAYKVILITATRVIYEISKDNYSFTINTWGKDLKIGDTVYI